MGVLQFGRKVSIIVGQDSGNAIELSELRVVYHIKRGDLQTPNSAHVRVYNVSETTKQRIEREFTRIVVQAGYEGNFGIIFDGTIKQVRRGRESQTDTYLDITAADGDSAYNFAVVSSTLAAGSTATDHVQVCTRAMAQYGVTLGYTPWGKPSTPKPTEADIAAQQKIVDEAKQLVDETQRNADLLLAEAKRLFALGDEAFSAGDPVLARQYYNQSLQVATQKNEALILVRSQYRPAYDAAVARLQSMQAAIAAPNGSPVNQQGLPRGKVMFGMARDFMRSVAKTTQTVWSIQDGKLIMVPETSYMPGEIPVITAETGMIGMPEQTQNGIRLKMLTNPNVKIGTLIQIDNASVQRYEYSFNVDQQAQNQRIEQQAKLQDDGFYYVMIAEHNGDTRGNEYYTDVICLAADVTVLPDFYRNRGDVPPPDVVIIKKFG
jgi:hypothetical protein